jgi:hypothetical protein
METPVFVLNERGTTAKALIESGKFIVLRGSKANKLLSPSLQPRYRRQLQELINSKALVMDTESSQHYRFARQVTFTSASAAASVVCGRSTNGRDVWIHESTGKRYGEWEPENVGGTAPDQNVDRNHATNSDD